jgi:hypothetical protein
MFMDEPCKVEISNIGYSKLKKLSQKLGVDVPKLMDIALDEFFELVCYETEIFLEKLGLIDSLKNIIKDQV